MHPRYSLFVGLILIASLMIFAAELITPLQIIAYSRGFDKNGCHRDNKSGSYHCHRGSCAGKTFASQAEMLNAVCKKG
jgi:hypothetical protein